MPHPVSPVNVFPWHRRDDFFEYLVHWLNARLREELAPVWHDAAHEAAVAPLRTDLVGAKVDASRRSSLVVSPGELTADMLQEMSSLEIMAVPLHEGPQLERRAEVQRELNRLSDAFDARLKDAAWTVDRLKTALEAVGGKQDAILGLIENLTGHKVEALLKPPTA